MNLDNLIDSLSIHNWNSWLTVASPLKPPSKKEYTQCIPHKYVCYCCTSCWYITYQMVKVNFLDVCVSGDLSTEGRAERGDVVPDAPEQRPWSGGHVHTGRAAWSCHHAQPLSALQERRHLCKAPLSLSVRTFSMDHHGVPALCGSTVSVRVAVTI